MIGSSEFASYHVEEDAPAGSLQAGMTLGSFRILHKLGEGGMGEVWAAEHMEIGLRAAVKVLRPEYSLQPEMARRFFNEARAVNIVQHPGIVKVFEFGRLQDRTAFIVMEFLEGEVLADRMERRGPLPFAEALVVMRQVASILETAHARNVVHRDLKPANVMMVADPEAEGGERAKLLDFGLAKLLSDMTESGTTGTHLHTRTGLTMGTPVYMAPEQCRGERDVSGQVDVYALGVMFYEVLTGKPPFQAKSGGELMSMHLRDEPPSLRAAAPQVPLAVTDLVHSMLRKDAAERPTMAQVVVALRELSSGHRSLASMGSPTLVARSRGQKVQPGLGGVLGRFGVLLGMVVGSLSGVLGMGIHRRYFGPPPERVSWQPVESGTKYHLRVVWGDAGELWAAGDSGTALHWNGKAWTLVPTPTTDSLRGLWGSAGDNLYAAGGHGTMLRWNGLAWKAEASGVTVDLRGLWGAGAKDVWAVGKQGTILHGDGQAWTAVPSGVKEDLRSVWGSGMKDVWAVGEYGVILHWDGVSWSRSPGKTQSWLQRVWGTGPQDLWAVGNEGTVLHWNGKEWAQRSYDNPRELSAVWGDGRGVWMVGNDGTILAWNGSVLTSMPSGTRNWFYGLWGVPGQELWAVGGYGMILRYTP